jgi:hypothetical protein
MRVQQLTDANARALRAQRGGERAEPVDEAVGGDG